MFINPRLIGYTKSERPRLALLLLVKLLGLAATIAQAVLIGTVAAYFLGAIPGTPGGSGVLNVRWVLAFLGIVLGKFLLAYADEQLASKISNSIKLTFRNDIFYTLESLEMEYSSITSTGQLSTTAVEGVEGLSVYFSRYIPQLFYSLIAPFILFLFIFPFYPPSALLLILLVPLIPVSMVIIMRAAKGRMKTFWKDYESLGDFFLQSLQGLSTLVLFNAADERGNELAEKTEGFRQSTMKALGLQLGSITVMDIASFGGAAVGVLLAGTGLAEGTITLAQALVILLLSAEFFLPLRRLGSFFHAGMNGVAAAEELFALFDAEGTLKKEKDSIPRRLTTPLTPKDYTDKKLVFEGVTFGYDRRNPVLRDISFSIAEGETVALVGGSGSGKSTLAYCIARFYLPREGRILLNGRDMKDLTDAETRNIVSFVFHDSHIFEGSFRENLLLASPGAGEEIIMRALETAGLLYFIRSLPDGLDSPVGERGGKLSGGQKQRLAIARALLKGGDFFVFDEATSNVDVENETLIWEAIQKIAEKRTTLIISHRLETVQRADRVLVLDKGRLVQDGHHKTLSAHSGAYNRLFAEQMAFQTGRAVLWG